MNAQLIPCAQIYPNPRSPGYQPSAVEWLADDIRKRGVLRPVLVRATERGYVIVHGERRWRAAKMLGLEAIPACVVQGPAEDGGPSRHRIGGSRRAAERGSGRTRRRRLSTLTVDNAG